jgi:hypothetical protein
MKKKGMVLFGVSCALVFFGSVPSTGQNSCQDDNGNVIPCKDTFYRYYRPGWALRHPSHDLHQARFTGEFAACFG